MSSLEYLNISELEKLCNIIKSLTEYPEVTKGEKVKYGFTMGEQSRHILEHYICFLEQRSFGVIDYALRKRDRLLETDKDYFLRITQRVNIQLKALTEDDPLKNKDDTGLIRVSSVGRELSFLLSHTIHHLAIIKILLDSSGLYSSDENLGVAISTLSYKKSVDKV